MLSALPARATYLAVRAGARKAAAGLVALTLVALPAAAATLRVIAIGDSLTAGHGLPQGDGFVPQLQKWLTAHGADVQVVNMGVSGDTTAGGLARLDWALADGADAVILELGGNDLLRGIEPSASRANLDAMLAELGAREIPVLLAGLKVPLNYGAEWKDAFESMFVELANKHGSILYPAFMDGVWREPSLMQPDRIHPNAEGVTRIVEAIGPQVLELLERAER